ncbi:nucleotidyltransferase domain-containing protein [Agrococcus sp. Marseille-P2731]|uniref:nucleotidyltransferase domain-containing protein n=1 Tax=Agrococcus sp. Marseille-P2731 TaxID=1841862 RepID=UPI00190EA45B|nr:nucleotidyltransferase domain-containing protein [Agrococcus sp. Marseille-P2731]
MLDDATLLAMAGDLSRIDGVVGVVLGGSRARGAAAPDSDVDLGVYLHGTVDEAAIAALAEAWSDASAPAARWTASGAWGPWVDGGAWLVVDGTAVDWIRRDLARVEEQWERAQRGELAVHAQPGHPHGFLDVAYCGELALGRMLADPSGALEALRSQLQQMPASLGDALAGRTWEARLTLDAAAKAAPRGDAAYVALCISHAALIAAHAIHGRDGAWSTNEKGLVAAAARLPSAPAGFDAAVAGALALGDASAAALVAAVGRARRAIEAVEAALRP